MSDASEPALYVLGALASLPPVQKALPDEARAALLRNIERLTHLTQPPGGEVQASQVKGTEADRQAAGMAQELTPPWELEGLARLARTSSALRPCIAAYSVMGPGFGWQLKPVIDVTSPGAAERVKKAMVTDRLLRAAERGGASFVEPTDEEVEAQRATIEREMAVEEAKLQRFLSHCGIDRGLTQLRKERTQEVESTGQAYWEVLRRRDGEHGALDGTLAYFKAVPSTTVRLRQIDRDSVMWTRRERVSPLLFEETEIPWRFRGYVQRTAGMDTTYFREYGDKRPRGARTGRVYASMGALEAAGETLATELVHWRVFDPDTPYGVPRWISAEFSVGGVQEAERVNYYYFDGRAIPPGILAVSGGKLKDGAAQIIEKTLTERAAGRAAHYSMLVMEATATGDVTSSRCRIEWIPLTDGSEKDGRFLEYMRTEAVKVQMQFRLPDMLTGRSMEANRAQADAALRFTEQQVFQPAREDEDEWWNSRVFEDLGIKWWTFHTNSAVASDPEQQMRLIAMAVKEAGTMSIDEGREFTGEVFNKKLDPTGQTYGKLPLALALAQIPVVEDAPPGNTSAPTTGLANQLRALRDHFRRDAEGGALAGAEKARGEASQNLVLAIETWKTLVDEDP